MVRRFIYTLHRISGCIVGIFLLMWFISGIILLYHSFPDISEKQKMAAMESIPTNTLPSIDTILSLLPAGEKPIRIEMQTIGGESVLKIKTAKNSYALTSGTIAQIESPSFDDLINRAKKWSSSEIESIDTLAAQDIWIMYSRYKKELPIYKFRFKDKERHQLYISSKSGEVLQFTSKSERFWAYLGAIPHKLYIPALRRHTDMWINTITTLSIIGFIAVLSGIYIGIDAYRQRYRKQKRVETPYTKRWYRWHHLSGVLFGLFLLMWTISGIISLKKTPQWIAKTHTEIPSQIKGRAVTMENYRLDYRTLANKYQEIKKIEWSYFQGIPIYIVSTINKTEHIDASTEEPRLLRLNEGTIKKAMAQNHGDTPYKIELIQDYENYYLPWKGGLALPVYRVSLSDPDSSLYYIDPSTGEYKYLNNNRKARKWLFSGTHFFHIKWLMDRPLIWTILIWTTALGCAIVSLTGVKLGWDYLLRKIKRLVRSLLHL